MQWFQCDFMEFKELGKHRVFLGFSIHTDLKCIQLQWNFFTSIETNKHTHGSSQMFSKAFLFRKYRIFWWFFKQYKHSISNTTYELTNISYVDVFQNTCILREPVNQGKSYSVTVAVYFWMNQTILIFGNVISQTMYDM